MTKKLTTEEREKLTALMKAAAAVVDADDDTATRGAYGAVYAAAYAAAYAAGVVADGSDAYKELLDRYEKASTYAEQHRILKEGLEK